jgi:hypothetical protein
VQIFQDLESGAEPLYYETPETFIDVRLPSYDKPKGGPVRSVPIAEYLATRRSKAGQYRDSGPPSSGDPTEKGSKKGEGNT